MSSATLHVLAVGICVGTFAAPIQALNGDYNDNGVVDAADYTIWRDRLGLPTTMPNDSTPGVDQSDYDVWRANFGNSVGGATPPPVDPGPGDPLLGFTPLSVLANGSVEYRVDVHTNTVGSALAIELAIDAPVAQLQVFGFDVDDVVNAHSFDGLSGYAAAQDTWYNVFDWFRSNPGFNVFTHTLTLGYVDLGSGSPLFLSLGGEPTTATTIELLHVVIMPDSLASGLLGAGDIGSTLATPVLGRWAGVIAQNGISFATAGDIPAPIPLPPALALAAVPAAWLIGRRSARDRAPVGPRIPAA